MIIMVAAKIIGNDFRDFSKYEMAIKIAPATSRKYPRYLAINVTVYLLVAGRTAVFAAFHSDAKRDVPVSHL